MSPDDREDPVSFPRTRLRVVVEALFWIFMLSFSLDYRAAEARAGGAGAGLDQLVFLMMALGSTGGLLVLGWRTLTVRPGAWMLAFWGAFLAYMLGNAFLQGVNPGRSLRIILPLMLCYAGMINVHIASCLGVRPAKLVTPILAAACINVVWRMIQGFLFKGAELDTVRTEVLSLATAWLTAFIACSILLRPRLHWTAIMASGVLFVGIIITITRSLILPIAAAGATASLGFLLGVKWGAFQWRDVPRRLAPIFMMGGLGGFALLLTWIVQPHIIERWNERLFHYSNLRNTTRDISWLTREAEASAIFHILGSDPISYLYGKGIGASYYWDAAYLPEIYLVYPKEEQLGVDVWFSGHSIWTYSMFSGGIIALLCVIGLFIATIVQSIKAAKANAGMPGPDYWIAFMPLVFTACFLSLTLTSNPFDERLLALMFGVMATLPQAFFIRGSWIHSFTDRLITSDSPTKS
ncbi:hypothetical protein HNR46_003115 [Haloferula luteola]|uniref:Uncharacterized protein n=1 Tax=Haloferula luteola TaxID=595692 RepID=A0A840V752_9BACT|nr:hypothetical protein [Haloferula luteola]MBB5352866.1 hypothetical protein [Haloferula luteola]